MDKRGSGAGGGRGTCSKKATHESFMSFLCVCECMSDRLSTGKLTAQDLKHLHKTLDLMFNKKQIWCSCSRITRPLFAFTGRLTWSYTNGAMH